MSHMSTQFMPQDCPEIVNEKEPFVFKWCDIPLFTWDGWDVIDTDWLVFYDCEWYSSSIMEALNQYYMEHPKIKSENRKMDVAVRLDGFIQITAIGEYDKETKVTETYTLYEGWIVDLHYVRCMLYDRFKEKGSEL